MTYKKENCILTINDSDVLISYNGSEAEIVEIPAELAKIKEVRDAIFDAYMNFGDTDRNLIYRILMERAPIDILNRVANILKLDF